MKTVSGEVRTGNNSDCQDKISLSITFAFSVRVEMSGQDYGIESYSLKNFGIYFIFYSMGIKCQLDINCY